MKHPLLPRLIGAAAASLLSLLSPLQAVASPSQPSEPLRVQVNVPSRWNMIVSDRLADDFVDRVREVFYHAGFDRPIEAMNYVADPEKEPYLLTVNLIDWRINPLGNMDCTFGARLQTPHGSRNLGLFNSASLLWFGSLGRYGLRQSLDESAAGAIRELCDAVAKSELLPDWRKPDVAANQRAVAEPSA